MKQILTLASLAFLHISIVAQAQNNLQSHAFYSSVGQLISYDEVIEKLEKSEIVLLGELHDHAAVHWIEKRIIFDLAARKDLVIGGEFMERDNQLLIDEYLKGWVNDKRFEAAARLWPNYETDYKPIMQFARDSGIYFVATNVPRRYASIVSQFGLDTLKSLPEGSKAYLPALPISFQLSTPGYQEMLEMMGAHAGDASSINFVQAQALKDAAMAEAISQNWSKNKLFVHINGDFHSANYGGIYHYLKSILPNAKISTLKVYSDNDLRFQSDWTSVGDIILVVPEDFTRTH